MLPLGDEELADIYAASEDALIVGAQVGAQGGASWTVLRDVGTGDGIEGPRQGPSPVATITAYVIRTGQEQAQTAAPGAVVSDEPPWTLVVPDLAANVQERDQLRSVAAPGMQFTVITLTEQRSWLEGTLEPL